MAEKKLIILAQIAEELNRQRIMWAIGGSLLLYLNGIVQEFNDIDIMIAEADIEKAKQVMLSLGTQAPPKQSAQYKTKHFYEFEMDGVDVDLMADFTVVRDDAEYYFPLEKEHIVGYAKINGATIPMQSVEAWRTYYERMDRVERIDRANSNYERFFP